MEGCSYQWILPDEPVAGQEAGGGSLLEVIIVVLGSQKQLLPHQDLISHVGTGMQCCQHLMCGSLLCTLHT